MPPTLISTENKSASTSGNITIPSNCTLVVCFKCQATPAPTLGGSALTQLTNNGITGIYYRNNPATGSVAFTGRSVWFYFYDAEMDNSYGGQNSTGEMNQNLTVTANDVVIGHIKGDADDAGTLTLTIDASAGTSVLSSDTYGKISYRLAPDTSANVLGQANGAGEYWWGCCCSIKYKASLSGFIMFSSN